MDIMFTRLCKVESGSAVVDTVMLKYWRFGHSGRSTLDMRE